MPSDQNEEGEQMSFKISIVIKMQITQKIRQFPEC